MSYNIDIIEIDAKALTLDRVGISDLSGAENFERSLRLFLMLNAL